MREMTKKEGKRNAESGAAAAAVGVAGFWRVWKEPWVAALFVKDLGDFEEGVRR